MTDLKKKNYYTSIAGGCINHFGAQFFAIVRFGVNRLCLFVSLLIYDYYLMTLFRSSLINYIELTFRAMKLEFRN